MKDTHQNRLQKMTWKDAAKADEIAELERLRAIRDAGADEYNAYYSRLMRRCQSRQRQAEKRKSKERD